MGLQPSGMLPTLLKSEAMYPMAAGFSLVAWCRGSASEQPVKIIRTDGEAKENV
jgi:hypothetical protein